MITPTLLVILGVLLLFVLFMMVRAPSGSAKQVPATPATPPTLPAAGPGGSTADVRQTRVGDVVSIQGAAADFSDLDFTVDRRSAYQTGNRRWTDLSGEFRGQRVYLEVYPGSEVEMLALLDPRRLTVNDLGISEDQLADMDTRQDPSASVVFEGQRWQYESSRELGYFENEQGQGEGLYRWLFRHPDNRQLLCVEKWEGEPFDIRVARRLNPQDVTVYRAT